MDYSDLSPYYQQQFSKIEESNEFYKGKFNWAAFLLGFIWAFSKGLWLSAVVSLIVSIVTAGIGGLVYWFIFGFRGNYMYYCLYTRGQQRIV